MKKQKEKVVEYVRRDALVDELEIKKESPQDRRDEELKVDPHQAQQWF